MMDTNLSLNIVWLYPDLMSTYGDRGNIITLSKRCAWRGIKANIVRLTIDGDTSLLESADLIFMGGGEDRQQSIIAKDLFKDKAKIIQNKMELGVPGLYICGAYQFLGKYYKSAKGETIKCLDILDFYTEAKKNTSRLVGNIALKNSLQNENNLILGFENHAGRTYLGKNTLPFGQVTHGYGNNGSDKTEGVMYKNTFGTYLHGPILPKNPNFADYLIKKALAIKYNEQTSLLELDDTLENKAKSSIVRQRGIKV